MTWRSGKESGADLELTARASARELHFEEVPETQTRFRGDVSRRSFSRSRRRNLPDEVKPGVEYSDAKIEWRAAGWIATDEASDDARGREGAGGGVNPPESGQTDD